MMGNTIFTSAQENPQNTKDDKDVNQKYDTEKNERSIQHMGSLGLEQLMQSHEFQTSENNTLHPKSYHSKEDRLTYYQKTQGSRDHGKEYEKAMCILFALKLVTNDEVLDFGMTTNNQKNGIFDDIELNVTFKNKKKHIFLFQLKYKEDKEAITQHTLTQKTQKNKFFLPKYLEAISDFHPDQEVTYILYTNRLVKINTAELLLFDSYSLEVIKCNLIENKDLLLNTQSQQTPVFRFKPNSKNEEKMKLEASCRRFFIFSDQYDLDTAKTSVQEKMKTFLHCDVYGSFENFMMNWWSDSFVLTKHHVIAKLVELALSPYIQTISSKKHNEKAGKLAEAIMKFGVTVVDKSQEDIVRNIWSMDEDFDWKSSPLLRFDLTTSGPNELQKTKILWGLGKLPLVVKVDEQNTKTVEAVLTLLHKDNRRLKMIFLGNQNFEECDLFENLSDLEKKCEDIFNDIVCTFSLSIQDRGCVSLKTLYDMDPSILEKIRVSDLLKMSQEEGLVIGNKKQELPSFYIPRCVSAHVLSINGILDLCKREGDSVVIINCDEESKKKMQSINVNIVELSDYLDQENKDESRDLVLVSTIDKCSGFQFDQICRKFKNSNVYLFQKKEDCFLLLRMKSTQLASFHDTIPRRVIEESQILHYFDSSLNVFCAPPGMGKSTLIKVLSNNSPEDFLTVHVELIKYNKVLAKNPDYETMWSYFLQFDTDEDALAVQIKQILWKKRKVYLFLDGLDEVDSKFVTLVINFAKHVSSEGYRVWISSRENLCDKIKQFLNVVPIEIKEVDRDQQESFLRQKLEPKYQRDEIEKIVKTVYKSVDVNNSQDLLGIPLKLHIITEMFLSNDETFAKLDEQNVFVLTQMYKLFFQGKIRTILEKTGIDESLKTQLNLCDEDILEKYELIAIRSCLDDTDYKKLRLTTKKVDKFLEVFRKEGDKFGIIKSVSEDCETVFNHQTYAEYFACEWFRKHQDKMKLLSDTIFLPRYDNLRRMFNIMLAEKNPLHLAIIYKNLEQFFGNLADLGKTDEGGRTALHLACSYGARSSDSKLQRESSSYLEMMEELVKDANIHQKDNVFNFTCMEYAKASKCLYPLEKLLTRSSLGVCIFDFEETAVNAARLGYSNILQTILATHPKLLNQKIHQTTLLEAAVFGFEDDNCILPRTGNVATFHQLVSFGADLNFRYIINKTSCNLLEAACAKGRYDMLHPLVNLGLSCGEGNTILHWMVRRRRLNSEEIVEVVNVAQSFGVDFNTQNHEGTTAFHLVCQKGHFEILQRLLERDVDVTIKDYKNRSALHYASLAYVPNTDIISFLLSFGLQVNQVDDCGTTPLQLACREGHTANIRLLLENRANPNLRDKKSRNALHYSCQASIPITVDVNLLIHHGVDLDSQDENGRTALHLASGCGHVKIVKLLLEIGGNPNIEDNNGRRALHFAVSSGKPKQELIELLLLFGADVDGQNRDGVNLDAQDNTGKTALHLASGCGHDKIVTLLLENGGNPNIEDNDGTRALHFAVSSGKPRRELINLLLDFGADVNAQNRDGRTALHIAYVFGNDDIIELLLDRNADCGIKDNWLKSPWCYASK